MPRVRCGCMRCTVGGLRGPVVLILLGALFLIDKWNTDFRITHWWPVLLIVFGVMKVAEALAPSEGHAGV